MKNLTLNDQTQEALLPFLSVTETLIEKAIKKQSGSHAHAEIIAMPDLGLANNPVRMNGGFFTGTHVSWESSVPFVPVDTTVNSCGVMIIKLKEFFPSAMFENIIRQKKKLIAGLGYNWNFDRGNHFIILGKMSDGQPCLVLHASADEYKGRTPSISLYPTEDCWFADKIRTFQDDTCERDGRYLRYISGATADKFITMALSLEEINRKRLREIGEVLAGDNFAAEYLYIPHYGMSSDHSVAIGCSWKSSEYALLTATQKKIFVISPKTDVPNGKSDPLNLNPHGFGVIVRDLSHAEYRGGSLIINGTTIKNGQTPQIRKAVRLQESSDEDIEKHVQKVLAICPGNISNVITPITSISAAEGINPAV